MKYKKLWRGQLTPGECFIRKDGEYHQLGLQLDPLNQRLLQELSDEGRQCFEKIEQIIYDMQSISGGAGLVRKLCWHLSRNTTVRFTHKIMRVRWKNQKVYPMSYPVELM